MEIIVTECVDKRINLPEGTVKEVVHRKLKSMLGNGQFLRIRNGIQIITKDEDNWRHGSVSEEYVLDATELDLAIFKVLEAIHGNSI